MIPFGDLQVCIVRQRFFFSSRRRHTRCLSDWSSDVCSSDLLPAKLAQPDVLGRERPAEPVSRASGGAQLLGDLVLARSEERRVGKEGRSRWAAVPVEKNR